MKKIKKSPPIPQPLIPRSLAPAILVSGSLSYDLVFRLQGKIKEQIVLENGKLGNQSLMFSGLDKQIYFGGTGGNIAYGLSKLGLSPHLVSIIGKDFDLYQKHMQNLTIKLRAKKIPESFCATFYAMTDENGEQIGIFQGGCYTKHITSLKLINVMSTKELKNIEIAIFSAGVAMSIVKELEEFRKINKKAFVIFDPGQILAISFTLPLLKRALKAANLGIFNETEFKLLKTKFGLEIEDIVKAGLTYIIETKGADGSTLYEKNNDTLAITHVGTPKVKKVVDPTGAGDAYRAGLISGLSKGLSLPQSMKIGAKLGAKCVQKAGGQTYEV